MARPPIEIRPLSTHEELKACVALQRETWGAAFSDVVPASILKVSQRVGGVAAGAFDSDGRLVGFVYGITGVERGRIVHWSDMLAVRPEARNSGVGRSLKEYQRQIVKALGAETIYWTYDPLVARNAHINFNVFGVSIVEYVDDMYGDTDSDLHRSIGTDRLIVSWPVADRRAPVASPPRVSDDLPKDEIRIEIPLDVSALQLAAPAEAAAWRQRTRPEFHRALSSGYAVARFVMDEENARGYYQLSKP